MWYLWIIAGGVALLPVVVLAVLSAVAARPANLGVHDGRLASCPASPNCVCTWPDDEAHYAPPIDFSGSAQDALPRLKRAISSLPRLQIVAETPGYLRVEATSRLFRFVDDVEFLIDEQAGRIHFRSASRVGRSDLGANRQRMERIRQAFG